MAICRFIWFSVILIYYTRAAVKFPTNRNGDRFTSMIVKSDTDTIYVAENGIIHRLDMDVELVESISTCDVKNCENINKVMTMDNNLLIICGTGKNQSCQALNGSTVQYSSSGDIVDVNYLAVSADINRPAVGLGLNGEFYLGVTYGLDMRTKNKDTYDFLISRTNVKEAFSRVGTVKLKFPDNEAKYSIDNYIVYFRKIFHENGFVYFLTNQEFNLNGSSYTSKLVRICINEVYQNNLIRSYTDIVLTCDVMGDQYNLLQDAEFLASKGILVAVFSKGDDPENPTSESAVCIYTIDALNNAVDEAKKRFVTTCTHENNTITQFSYINLDQNKCLTPQDYDALKGEFVCPETVEAVSTKAIGNIHISPNSSRKIEGTNGKITKVKGVERYGMIPDIYCGTDDGAVLKFSVDDNLKIFQYEEPEQVDKGHSVKDLHLAEDYAYVLTSRKVFKHTNTVCSNFKSCDETMRGKNPSCGWCVTENRSTKKSDCPVGWLSSLSECVTITVSPTYIKAGNTESAEIDITLSENFPIAANLTFMCRVKTNTVTLGALRSVQGTGRVLQSSIPVINEHVSLQLELISAKDRFTYAAAPIYLYKCNEYTDCSSCLVSTSVSCNWCRDELKCKENCIGSFIDKGQISMCPKLLNTDVYVPSGRSTTISIEAQNLVSSVAYKCMVNESDLSDAEYHAGNSSLTCFINVSIEDSVTKKEIPIAVLQTKENERVRLEDGNGSSITVYRCEMLGMDCSMCSALKTDMYDCNWCVDNYCGPKMTCQPSDSCPLPNITEVKPANIGYKGKPPVKIIATNLGTIMDKIEQVKVGTLDCTDIEVMRLDQDFDVEINKEIHCKVNADGNEALLDKLLNVTFSFNGSQVGTGHLTLRYPMVTSVEPNFSPKIGGTPVTLLGNNLDVGSVLDFVQFDSHPICLNSQYINSAITCATASVTDTDSIDHIKLIRIKIDEETYNTENVSFSYLPSPVITQYVLDKSIVSGGTNLTAIGRNLMNAASLSITAQYAGETTKGRCFAFQDSLRCESPEAPPSVKEEMDENLAGDDSDQSAAEAGIDVQVIIKMDGYESTFTVRYFKNPEFDEFSDFERTKVFKSSPSDLIITGTNINLAARMEDYQISIGKTGKCVVTHITESNMTCIPPTSNPDGTEKLEVVVNVGFFTKPVGYVKYDFESTEEAVGKILKIVIPIVCGIILIGVLFAIFGGVKYRRVKTKAKKFEDNLADMELKIKKVFREEFLDMHTTMSRVNESLIEKGFPYNSYQRYSFLLMFPGEWHMEEHPLMHEPVVSNRQVSDAVRVRLKKGMETFEELLLNKFFLLSVISTMEKQKKFFLKEKSNMAGYLSVGLLGKMEYFHEILTVLLTNLVSDTPTKSQKTLFRRCESITEKLLSNWLVLSLYPHVKMHSGSPLYMLLKGTQLTMESGPIDAITGDSKYTLSEEKLLKQDDKPNTLTLKIMVDNSDEIRDCKVLDCDTISQVKAKCLSQIYVNYPASQLTVDSSELNLEWHWGIGGRIVIKDEDTSSKREGEWLQLNTLEHYRVQDESSLALVDPHGAIEQEDYVNLAQIKIDPDPGCNSSIHSNEPLAPHDEEDGGLITRWHLVKPETDQHKPGSVVIDELYLNRLITTKQSVLEFMRNLFDTILNNTVPPPAKFLFDLLDELGDQNKVDPDSVHAWKSQCYLIRFWATLINKPYNLFDQRIPSYVETSMEVISQVLIESCSLKAHQYTKDSSPGKLIFKNDMVSYRDKVKDYYTRVKDHQQTEEDLRQYLTDLNRFQHQQMSFNKHAALYTLYMQLQPYIEEIMEDLESNSETKSLHLDRKLANLINKMQED